MINFLAAIWLSSGGSTHLHTNNTQNNTNNNRTTQIQANVEECGSCPVFCEFYPGICLTTEKKPRKNLSQGKKSFSQSTVYILPKTRTHYKTLTNTHMTKPTHTHTQAYTHITKQCKTTTVQIKIKFLPTFRMQSVPKCRYVKFWRLESTQK
jgi:hypothetical protein